MRKKIKSPGQSSQQKAYQVHEQQRPEIFISNSHLARKTILVYIKMKYLPYCAKKYSIFRILK